MREMEGKRENRIFIEQKKQECQHEWETISDFVSYGYTQCKNCGECR